MAWGLEIAETAVKTRGALQKPAELACLLDLARRLLKPDQAVVEIGCDVGGTLWAWSKLPSKPSLFGVTLLEDPATKHRLPDFAGATIIDADSHSKTTHQRLVKGLAGRSVGMLFIDGDHRLEAVTSDFWLYRSLVAPGGLIALHDISPHMDGYCEVDRLWNSLEGSKLEIKAPPRETLGIGVLLV